VAITLTAASSVFFAELFWTPGSMLQAEDRVHRIGQLSPVHIMYFLGTDTVDNVLWPLLQKKMKTLGELFEGERNAELVAEGGDDEVVGIVEDISLEEEQKLLRREAEGDDDASNEDSRVDVNSMPDTASASNEVDSLVLSKDGDLVVNSRTNELPFEYDGLAQAMLNTSSSSSSSDQKSGPEYLMIDDDDEEENVVGVRLPLSSTVQGRVEVVDLVDDCEGLPSARIPIGDSKPQTYLCIDLDDDDNADAGDIILADENICVKNDDVGDVNAGNNVDEISAQNKRKIPPSTLSSEAQKDPPTAPCEASLMHGHPPLLSSSLPPLQSPRSSHPFQVAACDMCTDSVPKRPRTEALPSFPAEEGGAVRGAERNDGASSVVGVGVWRA
jgi:hypothetical protein